MTSPPEDITVRCPSCGRLFEDWYRPSVNLQLDDFDEEYMREATTATCPECRTQTPLVAALGLFLAKGLLRVSHALSAPSRNRLRLRGEPLSFSPSHELLPVLGGSWPRRGDILTTP